MRQTLSQNLSQNPPHPDLAAPLFAPDLGIESGARPRARAKDEEPASRPSGGASPAHTAQYSRGWLIEHQRRQAGKVQGRLAAQKIEAPLPVFGRVGVLVERLDRLDDQGVRERTLGGRRADQMQLEQGIAAAEDSVLLEEGVAWVEREVGDVDLVDQGVFEHVRLAQNVRAEAPKAGSVGSG